MNRSDFERLCDARDFARYAQDNAGGLSAECLADAKQPQHAALYDLAIIGETLNKVSVAVKSAAPSMEWKLIADLRNLIVHAYWQIDLEIIADVIQNRLDPLIVELDRLIAFVERSEK
ncbi:MAG: HepT-like ribonuclease domain-containing protein [Xanthobacteraceae bacterium]